MCNQLSPIRKKQTAKRANQNKLAQHMTAHQPASLAASQAQHCCSLLLLSHKLNKAGLERISKRYKTRGPLFCPSLRYKVSHSQQPSRLLSIGHALCSSEHASTTTTTAAAVIAAAAFANRRRSSRSRCPRHCLQRTWQKTSGAGIYQEGKKGQTRCRPRRGRRRCPCQFG